MKQWRLNVSEIHYDLSNVEFYGAVADAQLTANDLRAFKRRCTRVSQHSLVECGT